VIGAAAIVATPIVWTGVGLAGKDVRDDLDIYGFFMGTPINLIFPLVAVFLTCTSTYLELGNRFVANRRTRSDIRRYLVLQLARTLALSFGTFFLFAFVPFVIAFCLWPAIGNPGVDPAGYHLSAAQARSDSYSRYTFSSLLAYGDPVFGLVYSALVAAAGAVFASFGLALLLVLRNRIVAIMLPFIVYLVESLGAALGGPPAWGLVYGLFPFQIAAAPPWEAISPLAAIAAVGTALWIRVFYGARTLPTLA
jgi:hypothetical protein